MQEHRGGEVGQCRVDVALLEVDLATVLAGKRRHARPFVRLGVENAVRQFVRGLVELALELQDLGATDATGCELFARSREPRLAHCLIGDLQRLVETADESEKRNLLIEGGQAAQRAEFVQTLSGGAEVDFFTQGDCVVANDDAQRVVL